MNTKNMDVFKLYLFCLHECTKYFEYFNRRISHNAKKVLRFAKCSCIKKNKFNKSSVKLLIASFIAFGRVVQKTLHSICSTTRPTATGVEDMKLNHLI